MRRYLVSCAICAMSISCIDVLQKEFQLGSEFPIAIDGNITDKDGPYEVRVTRSFDVLSEKNLNVAISAKKVLLTEVGGASEVLKEERPGIFRTAANGIKGRIGSVYILRVEIDDNIIFESIPDTLLSPPRIESLTIPFVRVEDNVSYRFDVLANGRNLELPNRYMWSTSIVFKGITHPERANTTKTQCFPLADEFGKCNFLPYCTGLRNVSQPHDLPRYVEVGPCTCCTCWYTIYNNHIVLSNDAFDHADSFTNLKTYEIPMNEWTFTEKVYATVTVRHFSLGTYSFFKAVKEQKDAAGSLFQPITGKIPSRFIQVRGSGPPPFGVFFAAGVDSKSSFVTREDMPPGIPIPVVRYDLMVGLVSCFDVFPNASNEQPPYW